MGLFFGLVIAGFLIGLGVENAGRKIAAGLHAVANEMQYDRYSRRTTT